MDIAKNMFICCPCDVPVYLIEPIKQMIKDIVYADSNNVSLYRVEFHFDGLQPHKKSKSSRNKKVR